MRALNFLDVALMLLASHASAQIYRCTVNGKTVFTDDPCPGAVRVEVTPTQGLDKWSGNSRKGHDVLRAEQNRRIDQALRPLTGKTHEQMNVSRRRYQNSLTPNERAECGLLDGTLHQLERKEKMARGDELQAVQLQLLEQRRRYRALKC